MNASMSTKTCIIGRSPTGRAVLSFENEEQARRSVAGMPGHRIRFYRQTITEEEVQITI